MCHAFMFTYQAVSIEPLLRALKGDLEHRRAAELLESYTDLNGNSPLMIALARHACRRNAQMRSRTRFGP